MRKRTLDKEYVEKFLKEIPKGEHIINFAGLGEFFADSNALYYLSLANKLGFIPTVTSNASFLNKENIDGMLEAGVRTIIVSTDACSESVYEEIRLRGANFKNILEAFAYLKAQKSKYPDLVIQSNNILMGQHTEEEFVEFWREKVDVVNVSALMTDPYSYDNLPFSIPEEKTDCIISAFLLPSGKISPCCTITAVTAAEHLDWLPDIRENTPLEAYNKLVEMYYDANSPLQKHCKKCMSWIRSHPDGNKFFKSIAVSGINHEDVLKNLTLELGTGKDELKTMYFPIHLFIPENLRVKPIICANNRFGEKTSYYLNSITVEQSDKLKTWAGKAVRKKTYFPKNTQRIDTAKGILAVLPVEQTYEYLWVGPAFDLKPGASVITCEAAALEGKVAFGLLDAESEKWFLPPRPLSAETSAKMLLEQLYELK